MLFLWKPFRGYLAEAIEKFLVGEVVSGDTLKTSDLDPYQMLQVKNGLTQLSEGTTQVAVFGHVLSYTRG